MKIAVVSANLGSFEQNSPAYVAQSIPVDIYKVTDKEFPLRSKSMTPRLQARIVKMFSWQMFPDYDLYLWVDGSCILSSPESVQWFVNQLGSSDMAVFKHPHRKTIQEEADYLKYRLSIDCPYITPRYENELIDEQLREVNPSQQLYASTAYIYRNTMEVRDALKEWWYHTSRYHSIDQLSLPFVTRNLRVKVIPDNYLKCDYLTYVRK